MATKDNLQDAFAGESQANRKYLAFARKAEQDGFPQVARLFRAAAEAETVHAHAHLRAMAGIQGTADNLAAAIEEGAALRVRPKMMTVVAIMAGLAPIMWSHGSGSQVMKRIAAPMIGGMVSATILTLVVVPVIYGIWKGWQLPEEEKD